VPVVVVKMSRQRGRHKQVEKSNCTVCRRGGGGGGGGETRRRSW